MMISVAAFKAKDFDPIHFHQSSQYVICFIKNVLRIYIETYKKYKQMAIFYLTFLPGSLAKGVSGSF